MITIAIIACLGSIAVFGLLSVLADLLDKEIDESGFMSADDVDPVNELPSAMPKQRSQTQ
ncbi:MAG: hypothetical protein QOD56_2861 [Gammaproteobacteria bacterium]|jgi:hypothetical protein|nr:hypothetical protein [Gammaproteobacteria bacterium]